MAKKSAAKKTQTKAEFVRSFPRDVPAKDVVAKAKEAKSEITESYVYKIRSTAAKAKGKAPKGKAAAPKGKAAAPKGRTTAPKVKTTAPKVKPAAAAVSHKPRGRKPAKKSLVLSLVVANPSWTAEQVAKAAGSSTAYVYSVWKKKRAAAPKKAGRPAGSPPQSAATTEFYKVLKRVGVERAKQLIANIEAFQNA